MVPICHIILGFVLKVLQQGSNGDLKLAEADYLLSTHDFVSVPHLTSTCSSYGMSSLDSETTNSHFDSTDSSDDDRPWWGVAPPLSPLMLWDATGIG